MQGYAHDNGLVFDFQHNYGVDALYVVNAVFVHQKHLIPFPNDGLVLPMV